MACQKPNAIEPVRELVKKALRVKTDAFNDEIDHLLVACTNDLALSGAICGVSPHGWGVAGGRLGTLEMQAYILYAKANFGYSPDSEKYRQAYEQLKTNLCLSSQFNGTSAYLRDLVFTRRFLQSIGKDEGY